MYFLEGVILDKPYLQKLQDKFKDCKTTFCGFGVYTDILDNHLIEWNLNNTFIQDKGINQDFGLFDSPDDFYVKQFKINIFKLSQKRGRLPLYKPFPKYLLK